MTNPYAAPKATSDLPRSGLLSSLLKQILWQTLAGAAYIPAFMVLYQLVPGEDLAQSTVAMVPLILGTACRAGFCRASHQVIVAAVAVAWGFLWGFVCFGYLQSPSPTINWPRFTAALLILPAIFTVIGWPIMVIARRRKHSIITNEPSGGGQ